MTFQWLQEALVLHLQLLGFLAVVTLSFDFVILWPILPDFAFHYCLAFPASSFHVLFQPWELQNLEEAAPLTLSSRFWSCSACSFPSQNILVLFHRSLQNRRHLSVAIDVGPQVEQLQLLLLYQPYLSMLDSFHRLAYSLVVAASPVQVWVPSTFMWCLLNIRCRASRPNSLLARLFFEFSHSASAPSPSVLPLESTFASLQPIVAAPPASSPSSSSSLALAVLPPHLRSSHPHRHTKRKTLHPLVLELDASLDWSIIQVLLPDFVVILLGDMVVLELGLALRRSWV